MSIKPILFSGPMVRAILKGWKAQTRRALVLDQHGGYPVFEFGKKVSTTAIPNWPFENRPDWSLAKHCVGDMLYVREAWRTLTQLDSSSPSKITSDCLEAGYKKAWCPIKYSLTPLK